MRTIFISVVLLILSFAGMSSKALAQSGNCVGLSGAAYGLCLSANAVGCNGTDTQPPGCTQIETRYTEITGETAPWTLPPCPCGDPSRFVEVIKDSGAAEIDCHTISGTEGQQLLTINTRGFDDQIIFTYLAPFSTSKHTCGFYKASEADVTEDQATACAKTMVLTAEKFRAECEFLTPK